MKILVLGAGGMAGHVLAGSLLEKGHEVVGLARRELSFCATLVADARDSSALGKTIVDGRFGAVVNCIGVLNAAVDANPYDGIWLNACLPHLLAALTKNMATRVIHISTDCVFSGHDGGGYAEDAFRSADTLYGRSKALGELNDDKNLTFRTSIVGPDLNPDGTGLFNWFMRQRGAVDGFTDVLWTGVTTMTLADAVHAALEQNLSGLYHLVNSRKISKFELLALFNELRASPVPIMPVGTVKADKSLVNTRRDFAFAVPSYAAMSAQTAAWIRRHKEAYPHYEGVMTA